MSGLSSPKLLKPACLAPPLLATGPVLCQVSMQVSRSSPPHTCKTVCLLTTDLYLGDCCTSCRTLHLYLLVSECGDKRALSSGQVPRKVSAPPPLLVCLLLCGLKRKPLNLLVCWHVRRSLVVLVCLPVFTSACAFNYATVP